MPIDYKKELENIANSMILMHEPDELLRIMLRTVLQKMRVKHASILLFDREKQSYVLTDSRGTLGEKIPVGFARIDKDDPLIIFFRKMHNRLLFSHGAVIADEAKKALHSAKSEAKNNELLTHVLYQMETFDTEVCIPCYFRDELLALLLLGKKNNTHVLSSKELDFLFALASNMAMAIKNAQLFKDLERELEKKHQLFARITIALACAIEAKDNYTHGHTSRVTNLSLNIAEKLKGDNTDLPDKFFENLHIASLLHDIGKIGVPEYILNKRGDLTIGERNRIKEHPQIGATILHPIKELDDAILGVRHHHERFDGHGYPDGLKGEEIPLIASIISVADTFDAMTTERPYRASLTRDDAVSQITKVSGKQLNPRISELFLELLKEGKI
jgi:putative nucleotidyltransferase with HDIG domain